MKQAYQVPRLISEPVVLGVFGDYHREEQAYRANAPKGLRKLVLSLFARP